MARTKSSSQWLRRHVTDPFVKQAQKDGYRSRSAYKLTELDQRDKLFRPGMQVMDLGSAPGGWSQVAGRLVGAKGRVLATDILPMDPLPNVDFIQGDFTDEAIVQQIHDWLQGTKFDLIVSDIAPNITGIDSADQASSMYFRARARYRAQDTQTRRSIRCQDVPGRRVGCVSERASSLVRQGVDPQAGGLTSGIARGVYRRQGF